MIFEGISVEPLIHKNRALPDYYISKCGKILSFKKTKATGIPKWHKVNKKQQIDHKERGSNPKYVRPKCTNLSIPIGFFPEYDFTRCTSNKGVKSKNHSKVPVRAHRAVKETYASTLTTDITGAVTETYSSTQATTATGEITIVGSKVNLNP